jgi:hypothetical protein
MFRRLVFGVSAFAIVSAGPLASGAAHADPIPPYYCNAVAWTGAWEPERGHAWCDAGHGRVRVVIRCVNDDNRGTTVFGPWKSVPNGLNGTQSSAYCNSTYPWLTSARYETQSL